jgi:uncharacterized membrane protein YheB (UPF0754 family)
MLQYRFKSGEDNTTQSVAPMEYLRFIVYPLVGSFLGFITNFIAIKLLFRPRKKILGVQGLLPKRQDQIAERAGRIVNDYLVNSEEIRKQLDEESLGKAIDRYFENNKTLLLDIPILKGTLKKVALNMLIDHDGYFKRTVIESFIDRGMVLNIVKQKIREFDVGSLEKLAKNASGPELKFIIFTGACLGFVIGLSQAFIGL